jgi:hypothetical protein
LELEEVEEQLMAMELTETHHQDLEHQQQVVVAVLEVIQLMVLLVVLAVVALENKAVELAELEVREQQVKVMLEVQVFLLP